MKFIVDAQLPKSLARLLVSLGHDAIHTLDLPLKNATGDSFINDISMEQNRVVISKDSDFYDSFRAKKEPHKLLYLTVGNMRNAQLLALFSSNIDIIVKELTLSDVVEMNTVSIIAIV
jgi:predicted nuclease of predicted toxin-antitoxin system